MINVCRSEVMNCALRAFGRARFDPKKKISVVFIDSDGNGEGAVDDGGPLCEFLRLLMIDLRRSAIFQGPENQKNLSLDVNALQTGLYRLAGMMISVCLIHGGVAPNFFSDRLFNWISGKPTGPASLKDVGDQQVKDRLQKIKNAETIDEAREAIIEASEALSVLGTMRYISSMNERDHLVTNSIQQYVEGRVQTAFQEMFSSTDSLKGLNALKLAEAIQAHPAQFKGLFLENTQELNAAELINLFHPVLSTVGSSRRREESRVLCYWRDWLIDVEGGECSELHLKDILIFASGLSRIPPLGFPVQPTLEFLHTASNTTKPLPDAHTCSVVLRLPLHTSFAEFKFWMESGIIQSPTFGVS
ncbi:hypothetical protein QQF64_026524 [Cirrhinus molitorella]|uniref:HECT domain-containing protein n=1 Tax=Cirrhinus molitorella TaxID=172907 RepID=A0ABR3N9W1_9TELE